MGQRREANRADALLEDAPEWIVLGSRTSLRKCFQCEQMRTTVRDKYTVEDRPCQCAASSSVVAYGAVVSALLPLNGLCDPRP
jgi:hypothetical protein